VTAAGVIATVVGTGVAGGYPGQLCNPFAVAVDARGNVYIADSGNNRIRKVSGTDLPQTDVPEAPAAVLLTLAGLAAVAVTARLSSPRPRHTGQSRS